MRLHIVLVEPEIPANTGNISRTCSIIGAPLHLVHPLGFDISEKQVKRAGLDYWDTLSLSEYQNFQEVRDAYPDGVFFFCTTKGTNTHCDPDYTAFADKDIFLVFGKETKGLPEDLLRNDLAHCIRIPMLADKRSLNLSNSVAVIAYEVLRQFGFENLKKEGMLL